VVAVWMSCLINPLPEWNSLADDSSLIIIASLPIIVALVCGWRLKGSPAPPIVQQTVGMLVGNLLLIQAAGIYFNSYSTGAHLEGIPLAIGLGLAYPVFSLLCRRFYAS
jgi:hypothetical protein